MLWQLAKVMFKIAPLRAVLKVIVAAVAGWGTVMFLRLYEYREKVRPSTSRGKRRVAEAIIMG